MSGAAGAAGAAGGAAEEGSRTPVRPATAVTTPEGPVVGWERPASAEGAAAAGEGVSPPVEGAVGPQSFERLRLIGRGDDCARVYLARLKGTERMFALKVIPKAEMLRYNKVKRVMTEVEILRTVHHPFVVTLYWSFSTINCVYFVMEYCAGGEFYRILKSQAGGVLPEQAAAFYAAEVLLAIEYLHMVGFMYRDLKPENILMSCEGHIVLTGFEMGKSSPPTAQTPCQLLRRSSLKRSRSIATEPHVLSNSFVGTDEYVAPEIITGAGHTSSVDWWTFGVFLYEMLYGVTPFRGQSRMETFSHILDGGLEFPSETLHPVSSRARSLIKELLNPDGECRLGAEQGACEIKEHAFFKHVDFNMIRNTEPPIVPVLSGPYDLRNFPEVPDDGVVEDLERVSAAAGSHHTASPDDELFRRLETSPSASDLSRCASPAIASRSASPAPGGARLVDGRQTPLPRKPQQAVGLLAQQLAATPSPQSLSHQNSPSSTPAPPPIA
eukprot:m51a1_g11436 putative serine threonine protein kinase (497) ;mRNA; f:15970-18245